MHEYLHILIDTSLATVFVVGMMALVEVLNFKTEGKVVGRLRSSRLVQVLTGSGLGVVPGCVGGFVAVGLYSQKALSFAGLLAMCIATVGDEAFLMLAVIPKEAALIFAGLFALAFVVGLVSSRFGKKAAEVVNIEVPEDKKSLRSRLAHLIPHGIRIFFWVLAIMLLMHYAEEHVEIKNWIGDNSYLMVLIAVLIGWIPQSGPHIAFIELFAAGVIPLPVLIANCITQDGHAGIPLILHDWKDFVRVKAVKSVIALAISLTWILFL